MGRLKIHVVLMVVMALCCASLAAGQITVDADALVERHFDWWRLPYEVEGEYGDEMVMSHVHALMEEAGITGYSLALPGSGSYVLVPSSYSVASVREASDSSPYLAFGSPEGVSSDGRSALSSAVAAAIDKAQVIAASLSRALGDVISLEETASWTTRSGSLLSPDYVEYSRVRLVMETGENVVTSRPAIPAFDSLSQTQMSGLLSEMTIQEMLIDIDDEILKDEELEVPSADFLSSINDLISAEEDGEE